MNLSTVLANNETVTVRNLINANQTFSLKKELISSGFAASTHQLYKIHDEILIWDDEGNVVIVPSMQGVGFHIIKARNANDPTQGVIVASLNETKKVQYQPVTSTTPDEDGCEQISNNVMRFYRADHPDTAPFISLSPLWLLVPAFQNLLTRFSEGDYSALDSILQVREPKANISALVPRVNRWKYPTYLHNVFPTEYLDSQIA